MTDGAYTIHTAADFGAARQADWVYRCAMNLLTLPVDEAISAQLAYMGEASGVDRAWMIEYHPDMLQFRNTHEWCRGQTASYVTELQDVPTTLIAWLHRYLVQGRAVAVHDVRRLPRTARTIQVEFLRQGDQSVLSVPVFRGKQLCGIIGFDTTVRPLVWSAAQVQALFLCADLIGQAKYAAGHEDRAAHYRRSQALLYLRMRGVVRGVSPDMIVGVRSAGNYTEIWLEDGSMSLDSRALSVWLGLLPGKCFFRVHRTAMVNVQHLTGLDRSRADKWVIRLRAIDAAWPVSRAYRKALRERLGV